MLVYDPEGNAHEKDPVDARECVKHCGYSYEPPEVKAGQAENDVGDDDSKKPGKVKA